MAGASRRLPRVSSSPTCRLQQGTFEVESSLYRLVAGRQQDVAGLEVPPCLPGCRCAPIRPPRGCCADRIGSRDLGPMCDVRDAFGRHQFRSHFQRLIDRNGKADSLSTDANGNVDADHVTVDIQQRTARVARIDAGVGLDQVHCISDSH